MNARRLRQRRGAGPWGGRRWPAMRVVVAGDPRTHLAVQVAEGVHAVDHAPGIAELEAMVRSQDYDAVIVSCSFASRFGRPAEVMRRVAEAARGAPVICTSSRGQDPVCAINCPGASVPEHCERMMRSINAELERYEAHRRAVAVVHSLMRHLSSNPLAGSEQP